MKKQNVSNAFIAAPWTASGIIGFTFAEMESGAIAAQKITRDNIIEN